MLIRSLYMLALASLLGCSQEVSEQLSEGQTVPLRAEETRSVNIVGAGELPVKQQEAPMGAGLLDGKLSVESGKENEIIATLTYQNNQSYGVPLMFASGKTADLIVSDENGKKLWFWSMGMMFTQAIREIVMPAGATQKVKFTIPSHIAVKIGKGSTLTAVFSGKATESQRPAMQEVKYVYP